MATITVYSSGNGYAYVDNSSPVQGDIITLYAIADTGETINDIYAVDQYGYSIALDPTLWQQQFTYQNYYGNITITVQFSGSQPPTPTLSIPKWLLFKIKENNYVR